MCYDSNMSLGALITNIITCFILIYFSYNNLQIRAVSYFLLFVGVMQLWDYIFWNYGPDTTINQCTTKVAMIWNNLEPIILGLVIIFVMKQKLDTFSTIVFSIYTFFSIIYSFYLFNKLKGTQATDKTNGSLYWEWTDMPFQICFYSFFLFTMIVLGFNFTGWIRSFFIVTTMIIFLFSMYKYSITKSTGRFWCYFASFAPIIFIFGFLVNKNNTKI